MRQRFDDDTAYDRLLLETVVGADVLLKQLPPTAVDDLRGPFKSLARTGISSLGGGGREALLDEFRPLLLATAWKVMDIIVELVKELNTAKAPPPRGWRISEKVAFVRAAPAVVPEPFVSFRGLWTRLAKVYTRLEEPRHAIIHRRFKRPTSGSIIPYGASRRPRRAITVDEVNALVLVSYGLAEELIAGRPDRRRCAAIAWRFDELRRITKLAPIAANVLPGLRIVQVDLLPAGRRWQVDLKTIREHMASQNALGGFADIEAYLPGSNRIYRGRLEDAPQLNSVPFAASNPPSWLNVDA